MVYNNLGNVYALQYCYNKEDREKIEKSKQCYQKASKAYKNINDEKNYYECLSNMARVMVSIYDLDKNNEEFEEIEQLLNEIIEQRFKLREASGAYISKIQLAQLYVTSANNNADSVILEKAIQLYNEVLDFYSKDYMPDNYYKIYFGRYRAKSLFVTLTKEWDKIGDNIKTVFKFLEEESCHMLSYTKELYVQQLNYRFLQLYK